MAQILVVDDEPRIRSMLQRYLTSEGYVVSLAASMGHARQILKRLTIDLVLLDLRLGNDDGLNLLQEIRSGDLNTAVIVVSGKTDVVDKVVGLEIGADDYVTKPFHLRELLARIKTVLRRASAMPEAARISTSGILCFGAWKMEPNRQYLEDGDGHEKKLTSAEYRLLEAFTANPHRILSRDQLLDMTSGRVSAPYDRTIDTQVRRLRNKLEETPSTPNLIKTIRGSGYMFTEDVKRLSKRC